MINPRLEMVKITVFKDASTWEFVLQNKNYFEDAFRV